MKYKLNLVFILLLLLLGIPSYLVCSFEYYKPPILQVGKETLNSRCTLPFRHSEFYSEPDKVHVDTIREHHMIYMPPGTKLTKNDLDQFAQCYFLNYPKAKSIRIDTVFYQYSGDWIDSGHPVYQVSKCKMDFYKNTINCSSCALARDSVVNSLFAHGFLKFDCTVNSLTLNAKTEKGTITTFATSEIEANGRLVDLYGMSQEYLGKFAKTKLVTHCIISGQTMDCKSTYQAAKSLFEQNKNCLWVHVFEGEDQDYFFVKGGDMQGLALFFGSRN
jgi:hypothetical protein